MRLTFWSGGLKDYRLGRILFACPRRSWEVVLAQRTVKQRVLEAVEALPADATIEDAMERLCFLAKIQRGLDQADAGETSTHKEAKERLLT